MRTSTVLAPLGSGPISCGQLALALVLLLTFAGCTHTVELNEQPVSAGPRVPGGEFAISVGPFRDDRGIPETQLGQIRGAFGEPGRQIQTDRPVHEIVEAAFREGLAERSMLADAKHADYELRGFIRKFDCNQLMQREAHAVVDLVVVTVPDSHPIYEETYSADAAEWHARPWYLAATADLQGLAERVLGETVDKAVTDWRLVSALRDSPKAAPTSPEGRLELIRSLHDRGYLTDEEYEEKRREIVDGI